MSDLAAARAFYVDVLGLPVLFEDAIVAVVGAPGGASSCIATTRGMTSAGRSRPAEKQAGSLSALRIGSRLVRGGGSPKRVQRNLGHSGGVMGKIRPHRGS